MKKTTTKNFLWNAVGLTFNSFNSLFFLIVVRYFNGLDDAGIFTYAFALCALFYVISFYFNRSFQLSNSKKFSFNDFFTCRIILSALSLGLIFIFSLINHLSPYEISIIMLLMCFRLSESISDCFYGAIHQKSHLYQTGISLSIKAILGLIVFAGVDFLTHNLPIAIASLTMTNLILFFLYDSRNYHKLYQTNAKLDFQNLKIILKTCFPVFLFSILSLYLANCQKYIMPYFESNEAQTIFGILIMPATMLGLIGSYLINPFLGMFTAYFEQKNFSSFINLTRKILCVVIVIGIATVTAFYLIGTPLLEFIYRLNLSAYQIPLTLVIIASILFAISLITSNLLTVLGENRRQTHIYILTSIITTLISILLIQSSGIPGAVYSFLISSIILVVLYIALLQFRIHNLIKNRPIDHNLHTFVILAYKESPYLERCIKSVINQSYPSKVIIATTTPNTFIKNLAKKHHLNVITGKHTNIGGDFDFAIHCGKTPLVTVAHQDDIYEKNYSENIINAYNKHPQASIIFSDYYEIRKQQKTYININLIIKRILLAPARLAKSLKSKPAKRLILKFGNPICCPAVTFVTDNCPQEIFTSHFQCNCDWHAWEKLSREKASFVFIHQPLMGHRISESSTTTDIINQGIRTKEDYEIFKRFWPTPIAKCLTKFYQKSEKSNQLKP